MDENVLCGISAKLWKLARGGWAPGPRTTFDKQNATTTRLKTDIQETVGIFSWKGERGHYKNQSRLTQDFKEDYDKMITQLRTSQKFSQKQNRFRKTPHQWKNSLEYGGKLSQCRGEKVYNSGEPDLQMARAPLEDELRNREGEKCPRRNQTALNLSLEMKGVHTFLPESTSKEEDTRLSPRKCPLTALKIKERVTFKETQQTSLFSEFSS